MVLNTTKIYKKFKKKRVIRIHERAKNVIGHLTKSFKVCLELQFDSSEIEV